MVTEKEDPGTYMEHRWDSIASCPSLVVSSVHQYCFPFVEGQVKSGAYNQIGKPRS